MGQSGSTPSAADHEVSNSQIQIIINDVEFTVSDEISADISLNTFIREVANMKGTKVMCHEGGCGACIVTAERQGVVISVNSCLVPVYICDGWKITTIEGIGNRKAGYHTLQAALADMNGSQCGYCSPGWVMSMYSLLKNGKMTMKETENSFGSNLCRCTGYRPILDTFKSFATDASPAMKAKIKDIEELYNTSCKICPKNTCYGSCKDLEIVYKSCIPRSINREQKSSEKFYKVLSVNEIFVIFLKRDITYIINGGNTAHGVYSSPKKQVYIDVNDVPELHRIEIDKNTLTLGGNVTLSVAKSTFEKFSVQPGFAYLKSLAEHIDLVASIPIRNIGTLAGNLMIKNQHNEFPSDIFLILEAAGARVHIVDITRRKISLTLKEFLKFNMYKKLIYSILLPSISEEYVYKSYKIMPRAQNAHAFVNAGFLFKLDKNGVVLERPNLIFGGIKPDFLHATNTENFLKGKSLFDANSLKKALSTLNSEINPDHVLPDYKPVFRKLLATGLFYKFVLSLDSSKVNPKFRSGATILSRAVSSGRQNYDTDRNLWPVNQPMPKIESIYQTSGEGEYANDMPIRQDEVFCALVLADTPGSIQAIESQEALQMDGVIAFLTAKDIPGKNTFIFGNHHYDALDLINDEPLFAEKKIMYAGQAYGIIAANSQETARLAASKVKIIYTPGPKQKPMLTVHDVLASNDSTRTEKKIDWPAKKSPGQNVKYHIKGSFETGPQYHFTMEAQTCVCVPLEDGMDVFAATQWMDLTQNNIATLLDVPANSINLKVRRVGGGYGAKLSRATKVACACSLVCHKLNRPTRLVLKIEDCMRNLGKRTPGYMEYDLSVDEQGKIQKMEANYYGNVGSSFNESGAEEGMTFFQSCYDPSTWHITGVDCKTDLPSNTYCRAPGSTEGIAMIENVMEHIAKVTEKDPIEVRLVNMNDDDKKVLQTMIAELKKTSDYENRSRDVKKFNSENRWKKRGISFVPMNFGLALLGQYHSMVSIYARDGTVSVAHAGIEIGQGINTKMAQIAAHILGIDLKMVSVKPSITLTTPNSGVTGGALTSDTVGYATKKACEELVKRLQPTKEKLGGNPPWKELVFKAFNDNVDLCSSYMFSTDQHDVETYPVYGATVSEVEIDVLTGQHIVQRVDILEDTGISLSPEIDVGQVEGAFIMGMGYWTSEDLMYDPQTGALTNDRTWNYKIPGAKDIPVDFRVSFRRNAPNPLGILRSKSTGEPPLVMSFSIPIAIRNALNSARADAMNYDAWYQLDAAVTAEKILLNSLTKVDDMVLKT